MEACMQKREKYKQKIENIPKEMLVYIDESGIEMTVHRNTGWAMKGKKLEAKKSGKYYKRTNIIAGYVNKQIIAPLVFYSSCNTRLFDAWVEQFLIKELNFGQYVVMDTFHKSKKAQELIESVGCKVIFLPPYSHDLNPIEKFWANMKRWIKNNISNFNQLYHTIVKFFQIPTSS